MMIIIIEVVLYCLVLPGSAATLYIALLFKLLCVIEEKIIEEICSCHILIQMFVLSDTSSTSLLCCRACMKIDSQTLRSLA
jgi:hypothetical protein